MTLTDPTTPEARRDTWEALDDDCKQFVRAVTEIFGKPDEVQALTLEGKINERWKRRI